MLTSAFRAFGGEELVKHFLTGLPGGFWTQFLVVMLVIFLLGFFLDFIEIAVVVVPIVAPILLADPSANITAVWFGVMVGLNIQTSFLTPPFGFALFYLRGVAPPTVKTTHIYKGAVAFIALQLLGLTIAGYFPSLVNYMPNRTHLTAETAPPPINPKLQLCMEEGLFPYYMENREFLMAAIGTSRNLDFSVLPDELRDEMNHSFDAAESVFAKVEAAQVATAQLAEYSDKYRPVHQQVRRVQQKLRRLEIELNDARKQLARLERQKSPNNSETRNLNEAIESLENQIADLEQSMPNEWDSMYKQYLELAKADKIARGQYRRSADEAYQPLSQLRVLLLDISSVEDMAAILDGVDRIINEETPEIAMGLIKERENALSEIEGVSHIKTALSKARRALRGENPDLDKSLAQFALAEDMYRQELKWRRAAASGLLEPLNVYYQAIRNNFGLRSQRRLPQDQAEAVASCLSHHRDISLHF